MCVLLCFVHVTGALPVDSTVVTSKGNYWSPSLFTPDVILVLLGTNDYSTEPTPTDEQFVSGKHCCMCVLMLLLCVCYFSCEAV